MPLDSLENFRRESLNQLQTLQPQEVVFFDEKPIEEIITIVVRPSAENIETLKGLINDLKEIEPNQYYYPVNFLHATILGKISAEVDLSFLKQAISSVIK